MLKAKPAILPQRLHDWRLFTLGLESMWMMLNTGAFIAWLSYVAEEVLPRWLIESATDFNAR